MANLLVSGQARLGYGNHEVVVGSAGIQDGEFAVAGVLRVAHGLAFAQPHCALSREQVGCELAEQKQNEARVDHQQTQFVPAQAEALHMSTDQVD